MKAAKRAFVKAGLSDVLTIGTDDCCVRARLLRGDPLRLLGCILPKTPSGAVAGRVASTEWCRRWPRTPNSTRPSTSLGPTARCDPQSLVVYHLMDARITTKLVVSLAFLRAPDS